MLSLIRPRKQKAWQEQLYGTALDAVPCSSERSSEQTRSSLKVSGVLMLFTESTEQKDPGSRRRVTPDALPHGTEGFKELERSDS